MDASELLELRKRQINDLRRRDTKEYYEGLRVAKSQGAKIAWCQAGLAPSLLEAMGILTCPPENYSAIASTKQQAGRYCETAHTRGIHPDLCSYGRCIMGMMWEDDGPYGAMPAPDIVIHDAIVCDAHAKMWEIPSQYYGIPAFHLDGSFLMDGEITERDLAYRVSELQRLVRFCEEHLGAKLDLDRFKENTRNEAKVRALLNEIQHLRQARPCPRSTRDMISEVFYLAAMPYSEASLEYMTLVAEDCRDRAARGLGAVEGERFRLYYDNIPLWIWLPFFEFLEARGAVCVSDSYTSFGFNGYYAAGGQLDPERPFESLAMRGMHLSACRGTEPNIETIAYMLKDWQCDGAIIFVNRSCKVATSGRGDKIRMINDRFGVPILVFEGEMADPLSIDKDDLIGRAKVFLEMLDTRAAKAALA